MLERSLRAVLIGLVAGYRWFVSPFIPGGCRFHPSCSAYADEAIRLHGPFAGAWLAVKRLARCHPLGGHGFDPVPDTCNAGRACSERGHQHS